MMMIMVMMMIIIIIIIIIMPLHFRHSLHFTYPFLLLRSFGPAAIITN